MTQNCSQNGYSNHDCDGHSINYIPVVPHKAVAEVSKLGHVNMLGLRTL